MGHRFDLTDATRAVWDACVEAAREATCLRSRCGAVVIDIDGAVIGRGHNSLPGDCAPAACRKETLAPTFKSDRTCCLHAEQRAIMDALRTAPDRLAGATIWFVRLDDEGRPKPSGAPYCSICSKMTLDVGIGTFVLWHATGFVALRRDRVQRDHLRLLVTGARSGTA